MYMYRHIFAIAFVHVQVYREGSTRLFPSLMDEKMLSHYTLV